LKESVLGLEMEGRVGCSLRKALGVKLEERERLVLSLMGFVVVCDICGCGIEGE
jgi:hypothetical protein